MDAPIASLWQIGPQRRRATDQRRWRADRQMNQSAIYLYFSAVGVLAGSVFKLTPRSAIAAAALNLIPAIGWYLGASGAT